MCGGGASESRPPGGPHTQSRGGLQHAPHPVKASAPSLTPSVRSTPGLFGLPADGGDFCNVGAYGIPSAKRC